MSGSFYLPPSFSCLLILSSLLSLLPLVLPLLLSLSLSWDQGSLLLLSDVDSFLVFVSFCFLFLFLSLHFCFGFGVWYLSLSILSQNFETLFTERTIFHGTFLREGKGTFSALPL